MIAAFVSVLSEGILYRRVLSLANWVIELGVSMDSETCLEAALYGRIVCLLKFT